MSQRTVLAVFISGLLAGGAAAAITLWLLSGLTRPLPAAAGAFAAVGAAAVSVLREAGLLRVWLPQNARQIPADVLRERALPGTWRFGFELGTGVRTYLPSSSPHVIALSLLLTHPSIGVFLAVGAGFGLGRAGTATLRYASRDQGWDGRLAARLPALTKGIPVAVLVALALLLLRRT